MIGCAAIILSGLSYKEEDRYLDFGLNLLKRITKFSFDNDGFPKSRNLRQLNFYLKYFVLIREWLKESQSEIPEYIDESIYYLGQAYSLTSQNIKKSILFNGNHEVDNIDFDQYLKKLGYRFKNENHEIGGYTILKDKKIILAIDTGNSPEKKFSDNYQAGALSFEIMSGSKKLICNSGYFQDFNHKLNEVSKSSATQSTLIVNNQSSCKLKRSSNSFLKVDKGLKVEKKTIIFEKSYWCVGGAHDGYTKQYGLIHDRQIEFFPENNKFIGNDKLIKKRNFKNVNFEIRFHLEPNVKVMKTQDGKSVFIEIENEAWRFTCENYKLNIETGLYFGKKNSYTENQNIFISGMTDTKNQTIKWEIIKVS